MPVDLHTLTDNDLNTLAVGVHREQNRRNLESTLDFAEIQNPSGKPPEKQISAGAWTRILACYAAELTQANLARNRLPREIKVGDVVIETMTAILRADPNGIGVVLAVSGDPKLPRP